MTTNSHFLKEKTIATGIVLAIVAFFWIGSRYPDLNNKAAMAGEVSLSDSLNFDPLVVVPEAAPLYKKVTLSTINWVNTNKKGMLFGVFLGASILTLLGFIRTSQGSNPFANALLGVVTGAPMGVCVNCAGPIGQSMIAGGLRRETALAAMMSSPVLNIVVVTMLFSLFPVHLAFLRIGFHGLTLLLIIPILSMLHAKFITSRVVHQTSCPTNLLPETTWIKAGAAVGSLLFNRLWYIVKQTVPFMFVAGFLGVFVSYVLPLEQLSVLDSTWITLLIVALVGLFLPCPIAFDVVFAYALFLAGANIAAVSVLLFSLGFYSVYAAYIVWKSMSRSLAVAIFFVLAGIGVLNGMIAEKLTLARVTEHSTTKPSPIASNDAKIPLVATSSKLPKKPPLEFKGVQALGSTTLLHTNLENQPTKGDQWFIERSAKDLGINVPFEFSATYIHLPLAVGPGLTAGDYNQDGWPDVAIAKKGGLSLATNVGGLFTTEWIEFPETKSKLILAVAFIDLNNDGWLDLYLSSYGDGDNYVAVNQNGQFSGPLIQLPNEGAYFTQSLAAGDIDQDGDLDLYLGNSYLSTFDRYPGPVSNNRLLANDYPNFSEVPLSETPSETLVTLFSDLDSDGNLDLFVGNDYARPSLVYGFGKDGVPINRQKNGPLPITTYDPMSIATADVNNDLKPDIFMTSISGRFSKVDINKRQLLDSPCSGYLDAEEAKLCQQNKSVRSHIRLGEISNKNLDHCSAFSEPQAIQDCEMSARAFLGYFYQRKELCNGLDQANPRLAKICLAKRYTPGVHPTYPNDAIPFQRHKNLLLLSNEQGLENRSDASGLAYSGWGWTAQFADYDHDEWQDVYVVNGTWAMLDLEQNQFFRNKGQGHFEAIMNTPLTNFETSAAYLRIDFDRDGDLDVISTSANGPVQIFENQASTLFPDRNSILVSLEDQRGNRFGLGAKIYVSYGNGQQQFREMTFGGGFLAYDEPVVHFGTGSHKTLQEIKVRWPNGDESRIPGPLPATGFYKVVHQAP